MSGIERVGDGDGSAKQIPSPGTPPLARLRPEAHPTQPVPKRAGRERLIPKSQLGSFPRADRHHRVLSIRGHGGARASEGPQLLNSESAACCPIPTLEAQ